MSMETGNQTETTMLVKECSRIRETKRAFYAQPVEK